jgi:hypothetical protein
VRILPKELDHVDSVRTPLTAAIGTIFERSHVKYIIALICRNTWRA